MSDKLRFGVIGTSWMNAFHMKSINNHPQAEVRAICGRDVEKANAVAVEHGVPYVHADYAEMIGRDDLDAVVVGAPDYLHHEMVLRAAEAGLHIVCEKPLAQTLDQAMEMLRGAESSQRNSMIFFTNRWIPHCQRLKQLLSEGFVGRVLSTEFRSFSGGVPGPEPVYDWHFDPRRGTGNLGNAGSHVIDLAHWLVGDIDTVAAMSTVYFDRLAKEGNDLQQLDDTVLMTVRYKSGAMGSFHLGYSVAPAGQEVLLSIHGDAGTLEASLLLSEGATLRGGKTGEPLSLIAGPDDLWGEIDLSQDTLGRFVEYFTTHPVGNRKFIDDILSSRSSEPSLRDGVQVQAVMEAAKISSQSGKCEDVPVISADSPRDA